METDTIDFRIDRPSAEELAECQVGDSVKLWTPEDNPEVVYIFRRDTIGGQGKLGKIPSDVAPVVSEHVLGGWEYEAYISALKGSSCTVKCRLTSREETIARSEEAARTAGDRLRKELQRKYVPKESLTLNVRLPKEHSLVEGAELLLRNRGLNHYVENAVSLEIEFTDKEGKIVATASSPSGTIKSILRASFSDIPMTIRLVEVERPEKSRLPYLESVRGKVEVAFK